MSDLRKLLDECTEGPWAVRMCDIDSDQCNYDQILADASFMGVAELAAVNHFFLAHEANARLIALAPDLAAALLKAEEALEFYGDKDLDGYDVGVTNYGLSTEVGKIIKDGGERARATLAEIRNLTGGK